MHASTDEGTGINNPAKDPAWVTKVVNELDFDGLTVESSDLIHFHAHQDYLLSISLNNFDKKLPLPLARHQAPNILPSPYSAAVLNLTLDAMYNREAQLTNPIASLSELSSAIAALNVYGIPLQTSVTQSSMIFASFSSHCQQPSSALTVYAIASSNCPGLHHLAVYASQYLHTLDLASITDEAASDIDAVYLHKLFMLHSDREQEFKRLAALTPRPHYRDCHPQCFEKDNLQILSESWILVCAFLASSATPDFRGPIIRNVLPSIADRLPCEACKASLVRRLDKLCVAWALVKVGISYLESHSQTREC